ncbi:MAG: CocE/NonD family hydrolase [Frankiales bacterium]|nr:CocE/NonD family hydrolase [Frankiales bacterium]
MRGVRAVALAAALVLLTGLISLGSVHADPPTVRTEKHVVQLPGGPTFDRDVRLPITLYLPEGKGPHPSVIVSPGFGQTEDGVAADARYLAQQGYVALAWTMRGFQLFNTQGGKIALDAPDTEVQDLKALITLLSKRSDVLQDGPGDPRVGLMGESYGGGISLMGATYDKRVDAIVPVITWNSLETALDPGGVFKAEYASVFFLLASRNGCALFATRSCTTYTRLAETGIATEADLKLLRYSSPDPSKITAPTLLIQGEDDTLFPLSESLRTAEALQSKGTPFALRWLKGGHDKSFSSDAEAGIRRSAGTWFDRYLKKRAVSTGPLFTWHRSSGGDGASKRLPTTPPVDVTVTDGTKTVSNPAGGRPASISSVPGAGSVADLAGALGLDIPGQSASWDSPRLPASKELLGAGTLKVDVQSSTGEAVLFAKVLDVKPDGSTSLPNGQVAPVRVRNGEATIELPTLAHTIPAGHRIRVTLASTDLAYAGPTAPATYTLSNPRLSLTLVPLSKGKGYAGLALVSGLIALGVLLIGVFVWTRRHRKAPDLGDDDGPLVVISGLAKSYADGFRAVDGVDMVVEKGQVLGLLGPNGAGKTTTLRMLAGLIEPTEGSVKVFGREVVSGAPVLSRIGFFIEGPGLLPHLTGMENLELYWTSTAPSMEGSYVEEALDIAGLGNAVDRPVRTYSQGMRQRLAIAQAMLGRPDLLVLDEPTNGLDPPQIKEVREVLQAIAATGRTVLVSSHLLAEVEQTCTHVVVMSKGKVVAQGPVDDLLADEEAVRVEVDDLAHAQAVLSDLETDVVDGALVVRLHDLPRTEVVARLVEGGVGVLGVASRRRLEDVFLELTS